MSSPRPSWRPLLAGTVALFLVILAFLAGQLKAGGDPALGRSNAATQQAQQAQEQRQTAPPQSTEPAPDDGFVPGGTAPAPPVTGGSGDGSAPSQSSDPPATHQS